jgi:hypothetical protein
MDDDSMDDSRMNEENVKRRQEQLLTNQEVQNVKSVLLKIQQAHIRNVDLDRFVQEGYHDAVFNDLVRLCGATPRRAHPLKTRNPNPLTNS